MPQGTWNQDDTFNFINSKILSIYGSKFGNNPSIASVYTYTSDDNKYYDIFYRTEKGTYFVGAYVKSKDNSF